MKTRTLGHLAGTLLLGASLGGIADADAATPFREARSSVHREGDDLLSAGLGDAGLRAAAPPAFADPAHPSAAELRRRAIWTSWRHIADLTPGGGFGEIYGSLAAVPGREFSVLATVPGRKQPHRVLVQVPDGFDPAQRCLLVAPSSGSRGIYGAIAVAGAWGLPKGCAVAYTDKGTGTDYVDLDAGLGTAVDGTAVAREAAVFAPAGVAGGSRGVAFKHAHSQDNPEADWGLHVRQAAEYGLKALDQAWPQAAPFTRANTRIIAVGISNGGGAVLRAAEGDGARWFDAVVAGEPSVLPPHGGRALYDYATEAALLMPCALFGLDGLVQPPLSAVLQAQAAARCASLAAAGVLDGDDAAAQAAAARALLARSGWSEQALRAGAASVGFDLWRSVAAAYASAYGRYPAGAHPCGFGYAALGPDGRARAASEVERAAWWADASGIPPGNGVMLIDPQALTGADPTLAGVQCLRALWTGQGADAARVRAGVEQTRAKLPARGLPVIVVHGRDDGLIPPAFGSAPYVAAAQAAGRPVRYWQVAHAQHFDAFLALPDYAARYVPLLPYVHAALDAVQAHLRDRAPLPADAVLATTPRGNRALRAEDLGLPR